MVPWTICHSIDHKWESVWLLFKIFLKKIQLSLEDELCKGGDHAFFVFCDTHSKETTAFCVRGPQ